ncbi:MAG: glycosyltransferase [Myxococcota bacterium]|nr:glycosyltransferase [Myxococcota bacterium]
MTRTFIYAYDDLLPKKGADSEQVMSTIAALSRAGVRQTLLIPEPPGYTAPTADELRFHYQVSGDFTVYPIAVPARPRLAQKWLFARKVSAYCRQQTFDVLHTRHLPVAFVGTQARLPVLYETYRPWSTQYRALGPPLAWMLKQPSLVGVMGHSMHTAESFQRLSPRPDRVVVMHNGYEKSRLSPPLSKSVARQCLHLESDAFFVTYSGRVDPEKGLGILLDIARRCPDIQFLIVGSRGEGPLERAGAGVSNLRFLPWAPYDVSVQYLYASDVLIIPPSRVALARKKTVLPMKLFAYLATGRPILAPKSVDTRELLRHQENAFLVEPGHIDDICNGLRRLRDDAALRETIQTGALTDASSLSWDARAERILAFTSSSNAP